MAKFKGTITTRDGHTFDMPAETCKHCKGIGYLTKPVFYKSRTVASDAFHVHRATSGDRCPMCLGHGWVALIGSG